MSNKLYQKSHIKRFTLNNDLKYAGHTSEIGEVIFKKNEHGIHLIRQR